MSASPRSATCCWPCAIGYATVHNRCSCAPCWSASTCSSPSASARSTYVNLQPPEELTPTLAQSSTCRRWACHCWRFAAGGCRARGVAERADSSCYPCPCADDLRPRNGAANALANSSPNSRQCGVQLCYTAALFYIGSQRFDQPRLSGRADMTRLLPAEAVPVACARRVPPPDGLRQRAKISCGALSASRRPVRRSRAAIRKLPRHSTAQDVVGRCPRETTRSWPLHTAPAGIEIDQQVAHFAQAHIVHTGHVQAHNRSARRSWPGDRWPYRVRWRRCRCGPSHQCRDDAGTSTSLPVSR